MQQNLQIIQKKKNPFKKNQNLELKIIIINKFPNFNKNHHQKIIKMITMKITI